MGRLLAARMQTIKRVRHRDFGVAWTGGIGIGAEVTDKAQGKVAAVRAGNHEAEWVALLDAPAVSIPGQRVHRDFPWNVVMTWSRRRTGRSSSRAPGDNPVSPHGR